MTIIILRDRRGNATTDTELRHIGCKAID